MKKTILIAAALGITYAGIAQDKYVTSALTALNSKNLEEAKTDIDKAIANPETKEKPKALLAKGKIYLSLHQQKPSEKSYYRDATQTLIKLAEVKPDYEKDEVTGMLFYGVINYYNDGINAYNDKKYDESVDDLKNIVKIHDLNGGTRFQKFMDGRFAKQMDTLYVTAQMQIARCAYAQNKYEDVITQLNSITKNPIGKTKDNYIILLESYEKYNAANNNKMAAEEMAATTEARKAYPNDPNIRNMEMNTMMRNNKLADLLKNMEDDAAKDANNADLQFNLGVLYQTLANPKDGKKTPETNGYWTKAEGALTRATKLAPENAAYTSALGTVYYQQAYNLNDEMSKITGTSDADNAKYDKLKKQRDEFFNKAIPPYESAVSIYSAKPKVEGNDADVYSSTLTGLKQIYTVLDKKDKVQGVEEKLKALDAGH